MLPSILQRPFGKDTPVKVSALGFGGHHLGDAQDQPAATRLIREAIDGGIAFFVERSLRRLQTVTASEMEAPRARGRSDAADGRYELFKATKKYDGDEGRKCHD